MRNSRRGGVGGGGGNSHKRCAHDTNRRWRCPKRRRFRFGCGFWHVQDSGLEPHLLTESLSSILKQRISPRGVVVKERGVVHPSLAVYDWPVVRPCKCHADKVSWKGIETSAFLEPRAVHDRTRS